MHRRSRGPLFVLANGDHLTHRHIASLLHAAVTSSNVNTHSFRIGADIANLSIQQLKMATGIYGINTVVKGEI